MNEEVTGKIMDVYDLDDDTIVAVMQEFLRLTLLVNTLKSEQDIGGYSDAIDGLKSAIRKRLSYYASEYPDAELEVGDELIDKVQNNMC